MRVAGKKLLKAFLFSLLLANFNFANAKDIEIKATPIESFAPALPSQKQFGKLEFLGGLVLTSNHEEFGGFSALRFLNENQLVLVTDKARVLTANLIREGDKPVALEQANITRIKASNGRTITGANDKDSESLEISGTSFFIGYERNDRIMRFSMKNNTLIADSDYNVDLNPKGLPNNKGPEAIALDPNSKKLFAFAEQALNDEGNNRGFVISGGKIEREISVKYRNSFSLTDATFLPNGNLLLLERYYNPFTGVFIRIREVDKSTLSGKAPLDGEILIDVNYAYNIDNMEGIAAFKMKDGSTRLTLISDNNFSRNQRTILLEFKLIN